jgi:hypothetical protein
LFSIEFVERQNCIFHKILEAKKKKKKKEKKKKEKKKREKREWYAHKTARVNPFTHCTMDVLLDKAQYLGGLCRVL